MVTDDYGSNGEETLIPRIETLEPIQLLTMGINVNDQVELLTRPKRGSRDE